MFIKRIGFEHSKLCTQELLRCWGEISHADYPFMLCEPQTGNIDEFGGPQSWHIETFRGIQSQCLVNFSGACSMTDVPSLI